MTQRRDLLGLIDYARGLCAWAGVRFRLVGKEKIGSDLGSFDHVYRNLDIAVLNPQWPGNLTHEVSHIQQWKERPGFYLNEAADVEAFMDWCSGKRRRWKTAKVLHVVRAIQTLELDCERRAVRLQRTFRVPNIPLYVQGANLYIWKHEVARRVGFWPAYKDQDGIVAAMPKRLMSRTNIGKPPAMLEELAIKGRA